MNKIIIVIALHILFANKSFSQTWSQTGGPTVGVINTFGVNSAGVLFAGLGPVYSGLKSEFYRSTNNGLSWRYLEILAEYSYDMIVKNDVIYLATSEGILTSSNNGTNWSGFAFSQTSYSIFSSNNNNNFFTGNSLGGIYRSTDGGVGWAKVLNVNYPIQNITGDSANNIFGTSNNILFKSSDAGNSWDSVFKINSTIKCINYSGNGFVFTGTSDSGLFASSNYGNNWIKLITPFNSIFSITKNNLNNIFVASESGVWSTTNNGQSWIFVNGIVQNLKELFFTPSSLLLAGTTHGIYKSTNEGINWLNSGIKQAAVNDIYTRMAGKIYTLAELNGNVHSLWSSTNRGVTWIKSYDASFLLLKVAAFDSNVYIGTQNNILRSTNNGYNFQIAFEPGYECFKLISDSLGNVFAGFGDGLYRSTNSGVNWARMNNINHVIYDICIVHQNLIYACGYGKMYKSSDSGATWSLIYNSGTDVVNMAATASGYIIFNSYGVCRSSNFGQNWSSMGMSSQVDNLIFDKDDKLYCTIGDEVYKSTNYGTTFSLFNDVLYGNNTCIGMDPDNYLYLGTYGTSIYKTNSPLTNLKFQNKSVVNFRLYQNYPNPFNPSTIIKFDIPPDTKGKTSKVNLVVFNVIGKEITTLVNSDLIPGSYELSFNGNNLPSGIYFYKLETDNFSQINKMILLK